MKEEEIREIIREELQDILAEDRRSLYATWDLKASSLVLQQIFGKGMKAGQVTATQLARVASNMTSIVKAAYDEGKFDGAREMMDKVDKNVAKNTRYGRR